MTTPKLPPPGPERREVIRIALEEFGKAYGEAMKELAKS